MRVAKKISATLILVFVFAAYAEAQSADDGREWGVTGKRLYGKWNTLTSEHFHVHFGEGYEKLADRVAAIAEDVHGKLSKDIPWSTGSRTHIKIIDWYDSINGWSSPLPRNTIALYPVGPGPGELELTYTDDWLRMVITHEYVHTLTIDMARGVPGVMRVVFGRNMGTIPNINMPRWIIEGLAIYHETKHTAGGRIRGPYFDMILRSAVLEDRFNEPSQAQTGIDSWPVSCQYIYGGMFVQYLTERFGEERFFEVYDRQSYVIGPFMPWIPGELEAILVSLYWVGADPVGAIGMNTFYNSYENIWREWHHSLKGRYEKQKEEIENEGLTIPDKLTDTGYETGFPRISPDGEKMAYISRGSDRKTQLRIMNPNGENDRLLYEGEIRSLDWSPDGEKIVFSMLDYWRGIYYYSDLYVCEPESRKVRRLTHGLRARSPSWSPDGRKILFAANTGAANTDLAILDLDEEEKPVTYLTRTSDMTYYSGCAWSPDGKKIAFARLVPGSFQQVCTAGADGSEMKALTDGKSQDFLPSWSSDGRHLLFTSSRTGVYNIFARDMESGKFLRLTNVLGGAIAPSLSASGKHLAYADYSSRGWDVAVARVDIEKAPEAKKIRKTMPEIDYDYSKKEWKIEDYNSLRTLFPTGWSPFYSYTGEYGAQVASHDVLEKYIYTLQLGYNSMADNMVAGAYFSYEGAKLNGLPASWELKAYTRPVFYPRVMIDGNGEYVDYWEDNIVYETSLGATVYRTTRTRVDIRAGYEWRKFDRISDLLQGGSVPATGILSSVFLNVTYDDTKTYRHGISATDGRKFSVTGRTAGPSLESDYRVEWMTADLVQFITVPGTKHHVLMGRVVGGLSEGDIIDERSLFHVGGFTPGSIFIADENIALRGYPDNEFLGTHAMVATLEYRFPLWLIESGPPTRPLFFRKLSGYIFAESGDAWSGPMYFKTFNPSAGLGIRLNADMFYQRLYGYAVDMGFAYGFDDEGINQFYFTLTLLW